MRGYDQRDLPRLRAVARALLPEAERADALLADALAAGGACDRVALLARLIVLSRLRQGPHGSAPQSRGGGRAAVEQAMRPLSPAAATGAAEAATEVLHAFHHLPIEAREVLALVVVERADYAVAALVLGLDRNALTERLTAARSALARMLEGQRPAPLRLVR